MDTMQQKKACNWSHQNWITSNKMHSEILKP